METTNEFLIEIAGQALTKNSVPQAAKAKRLVDSNNIYYDKGTSSIVFSQFEAEMIAITKEFWPSKMNLSIKGLSIKELNLIDIEGLKLLCEDISVDAINFNRCNSVELDVKFKVHDKQDASIYVCDSLISSMEISNQEYGSGSITISNLASRGRVQDLRIKHCNIRKVVFDTMTANNLTVEFSRISKIVLSRVDALNINLSHIGKCNDINFEHVSCSGGSHGMLKFANIRPTPRYKFFNCDLKNFKIELIEADIANAVVECSILPTEPYIPKYRKTTTDFKRIKLTILQLRALGEKVNDAQALTIIKSHEQEFNDKLTRWHLKHFGTKIAFLTHRLSNNYGRNWFLPLLWIVAFAILLYRFIVKLNGLQMNGNVFAQYLNPTHRLEIFGDIHELHWATGLLDYGSRIVMAYLAVQFVTAFRKHVKV